MAGKQGRAPHTNKALAITTVPTNAAPAVTAPDADWCATLLG
jgi:hypothetical protein